MSVNETKTALDLSPYLKFSGNPGSPFRVIGEVTLGEPVTVTEYQQYAANWTEVACEPQTVALESNGYYVRARLTGVIVGGGRNISERPERVGAASAVSVMPYTYQIADLPYGLQVTALDAS